VSTVATFVIVGAGQAGGTAGGELREEGFDGRVVVIGEEPLPPYERPPLSKEYLRGEQPFESGFLRPEGWWKEHDVELRPGERVVQLDARARTVTLAGGEEIRFDRLLLATGARNREVSLPGRELDGVHDLRTAADADRIRDAASRGGRAVLVGMGFIGAELAASLRTLGLDVAVIHPGETPLQRVVGPEIGRVVRDIHADHGVEMHFGERVASFEGGDRVEAVVTSSGLRVECDFAVLGVGVRPNVEIADGTGIEVRDGIVVDAGLETNVPGVFAAGDVAAHDHPRFGPIRVEHWDNALKMGQHAARAMMGDKQPFDDPHWFWSDQFDVTMQMAGVARTWDEMVVRGSVEDRSFSAFLLADGRLSSTFSLNRPKDVRRSMKLIRAGAIVDPGLLRDETVDLRTLPSV
jgi:3-phenylpropionate/trans-cinnamate dioxygenase ferredoxin reductase component